MNIEIDLMDVSDTDGVRSKVPAVSRAVAVLRALAAASEPQGVNPLARQLDLVPSTCMHVLKALVAEGLVDFDPISKRYRIGVGILPIARGAIERSDFATLARPRLADLSSAFGVTAMATQLIGTRDMVVIALSHAQLPFRLSTELGSRFPAFTSATGRCVAAFGTFEAADLKTRYAGLPWDNPPGFARWCAEIDEARALGYGIDRGAFIAGVTIVAAPFLGAKATVIRSLVAMATTERMDALGIETVAASMLRVRDDIDRSLIPGQS
jgi:DNA-binding IclR family transcriptional regulator